MPNAVEPIRCRLCRHPVDNPYRVVQDGRITFGCVHADHGAHLDPESDSGKYHNRPVASAIRAAASAARMLARPFTS